MACNPLSHMGHGGKDFMRDSMTDSYINNTPAVQSDYKIGQDLYDASVKDMQDWSARLRQEIIRLDLEIKKKQTERAAADSIFKNP